MWTRVTLENMYRIIIIAFYFTPQNQPDRLELMHSKGIYYAQMIQVQMIAKDVCTDACVTRDPDYTELYYSTHDHLMRFLAFYSMHLYCIA